MHWRVINLSDFVAKMPRYTPATVYEVNEIGRIRRYNPTDRVVEYKDVPVDGDKVRFNLGWAYGNMMHTTLSVSSIIEKYFH